MENGSAEGEAELETGGDHVGGQPQTESSEPKAGHLAGADQATSKRKRGRATFDLCDCLCGCTTFEEYLAELQQSPRAAWYAKYAADVLDRGTELHQMVNALPSAPSPSEVGASS